MKQAENHAPSAVHEVPSGQRADRPALEWGDHLRAVAADVPLCGPSRRDPRHHRSHAERTAAGARGRGRRRPARSFRRRRSGSRSSLTQKGKALADAIGLDRQLGREVHDGGGGRSESTPGRPLGHAHDRSRRYSCVAIGVIAAAAQDGPAAVSPFPRNLSGVIAFQSDVRTPANPDEPYQDLHNRSFDRQDHGSHSRRRLERRATTLVP